MKVLFYYQLKLYKKRAFDLLYPLVFLILLTSGFSMLIANTEFLTMLSPAIVIMGISLCVLYHVDQMWNDEYTSGYFVHLAQNPYGLLGVVASKLVVVGFMLCSSSTVVLVFLMYSLNMPINLFSVGALVCCVVYLTMLGSISSALTLQSKKSHVVMVIITLPLAFPMLFSMVYFLSNLVLSDPVVSWSTLYFIFFLTTLLTTLSPFFITQILKIHCAFLPNH